MEEWDRIEIGERSDRETVAVILIRNGYTVRIVRQRRVGQGSKTYRYFVEYRKEGGET